jgi:epoxyqueuosine reductase
MRQAFLERQIFQYLNVPSMNIASGKRRIMNNQELAADVARAAQTCGYESCGIVKVEEMRGYAGVLEERINQFPESKPLYKLLAHYAEPQQMFPWAKSVIICAQWYGKYHIPQHLEGLIGKAYCVDFRIDPGSNEHQGRLRFEAELGKMGLRYETQDGHGLTAMRWAAFKAGLGLIRKNNFFYTERGSWYTLSTYLIDQELELKTASTVRSCPEQCGLCIKACPTGALRAPYQTNGTICISFLMGFDTCEPGKKHYDHCGSWIYGCDACQNACPFNKETWEGTEDYPGLESLSEQLAYERLLSMDYDQMRRLLSPKFWYIAPENVWKWKCNVLNAMLNHYEDKYRPHIERALGDERAEVRAMAGWVLKTHCGPAISAVRLNDEV